MKNPREEVPFLGDGVAVIRTTMQTRFRLFAVIVYSLLISVSGKAESPASLLSLAASHGPSFVPALTAKVANRTSRRFRNIPTDCAPSSIRSGMVLTRKIPFGR